MSSGEYDESLRFITAAFAKDSKVDHHFKLPLIFPQMHLRALPNNHFLRIIPMILVALLTGCGKKETIVVLDHWWNADYVKIGCEMRASTPEPCPLNPQLELQQFESEMNVFFSSDPVCQGILFSGFGGPKSLTPEQLNRGSDAQWQLMLDYSVGDTLQDWSIVHRKDSSVMSGKGTPEQIAHAVCGVVKMTGGKVIN